MVGSGQIGQQPLSPVVPLPDSVLAIDLNANSANSSNASSDKGDKNAALSTTLPSWSYMTLLSIAALSTLWTW